MKTLAQAYLDLSMKIPVEDIKLKQRLDRAYEMYNSYGYDITEVGIDSDSTVLYHVHKASTSLLESNSVTYEVSTKDCTCPDYPSARGNLCKHRLAVMLVEEMKKESSMYDTRIEESPNA